MQSAGSKALKEKLEASWDIKWADEWGDILGFKVERNSSAKKTAITAPKPIAELKTLVGDVHMYTPGTAWCTAVKDIRAADVPPEGTPEHERHLSKIQWMRQAVGALRNIEKIRKDISGPLCKVSQFMHAPDDVAVKATRNIVFRVLSTPDRGITFRVGPLGSLADLELPPPKPAEHVQDVSVRPLSYHAICDASLATDDRSMCGQVHMLAGGMFAGGSNRQHSSAIHAGDSEAFVASATAARVIVFKGMLTEMGITCAHPVSIFTDSKCTRLIAMAMSALKNSIYIARRVLFMQEGCAAGEFQLLATPGKTNICDGMTKRLDAPADKAAQRYYMGDDM